MHHVVQDQAASTFAWQQAAMHHGAGNLLQYRRCNRDAGCLPGLTTSLCKDCACNQAQTQHRPCSSRDRPLYGATRTNELAPISGAKDGRLMRVERRPWAWVAQGMMSAVPACVKNAHRPSGEDRTEYQQGRAEHSSTQGPSHVRHCIGGQLNLSCSVVIGKSDPCRLGAWPGRLQDLVQPNCLHLTFAFCVLRARHDRLMLGQRVHWSRWSPGVSYTRGILCWATGAKSRQWRHATYNTAVRMAEEQ